MVYTQTIEWTEFYAKLDSVLAEWQDEHFEAIVAIAQGGIIPAAILQQERGCRWASCRSTTAITKTSRDSRMRGCWTRGLLPFAGKKVLLVDDVSRTGRTLARARAYLAAARSKRFS